MSKRKSDEFSGGNDPQDKHSPPKRNRGEDVEWPKRKVKVAARKIPTKTEVPETSNTRYHEEIRKLQETVDRLQKAVNDERKAKERALTRLSSLAANRLRDNNPGISDLSDPNRPLKVMERMSELYDNEWTNAMEALEEACNMKETDQVILLCNILTTSFEMLSKAARDHLSEFSSQLLFPSLPGVEINKADVPVSPAELIKQMKDFRKQHADVVISTLQQHYKNKLKQRLQMSDQVFKACDEFMDECIRWCWIMAIQDPPMNMVWNFSRGDNFNSDIMRAYTKRGDYVDYVVWPVLYLSDGGSLLAKGVVQGMMESKGSGKKLKKRRSKN